MACAILLVSCGAIGPRPLIDDGSGRPKAVAADHGAIPQSRHNRGVVTLVRVPLEPLPPRWRRDIIDTAAGAGYLSESERRLIVEINMVRTDPREYAQRFLVPLRPYYHGTLMERPGETTVATREGIRALDACIKDLQRATPVLPLSPKKGLTLAARDLARDQAKTGAMGHTGSDGSTDVDRINRYGRWDICAGENIDYGHQDARRIVISLLIDDGVPSRGHRRNLLDAAFRFVGVCIGLHPVYGHMCVMDFAGSYR